MKLVRMVSAVVLAGLVWTAPSAVQAQYTSGQKYAGVHVGLSGVGSATALGAQAEVAYNDRISIGGWFDTWSFGESFSILGSSTSWSTRYIALAGTGAYHFPLENSPKWDPFVGAALGYFVVNAEATGVTGAVYTGDSSRMFVGGFAGARYFFRENVSAVGRVGLGASNLTLGVDWVL